MADVVVSIVNHNSTGPLLRCLASILDDVETIGGDIWVVDNLCSDRAGPLVSREFPKVHVLENDLTLGFSANHNQTLRRALEDQCSLVVALNPDVEVPQGTLPELVRLMKDRPDLAVLSPLPVDPAGNVQWPARDASLAKTLALCTLYIWQVPRAWFDRLMSLGRGRRSQRRQPRADVDGALQTPKDDGQLVPCVAVPGAFMLFSCAALKDVGLLDEGYFLYFEETDWCLRARARGWQVGLAPHMHYLHMGAYSTSQDYLKHLTYYCTSLVRFYGKHSGRYAQRAAKAVLSGAALLAMPVFALKGVLSPRRRTLARERVLWLCSLISALRLAGYSAGE